MFTVYEGSLFNANKYNCIAIDKDTDQVTGEDYTTYYTLETSVVYYIDSDIYTENRSKPNKKTLSDYQKLEYINPTDNEQLKYFDELHNTNAKNNLKTAWSELIFECRKQLQKKIKKVYKLSKDIILSHPKYYIHNNTVFLKIDIDIATQQIYNSDLGTIIRQLQKASKETIGHSNFLPIFNFDEVSLKLKAFSVEDIKTAEHNNDFLTMHADLNLAKLYNKKLKDQYKTVDDLHKMLAACTNDQIYSIVDNIKECSNKFIVDTNARSIKTFFYDISEQSYSSEQYINLITRPKRSEEGRNIVRSFTITLTKKLEENNTRMLNFRTTVLNHKDEELLSINYTFDTSQAFKSCLETCVEELIDTEYYQYAKDLENCISTQ